MLRLAMPLHAIGVNSTIRTTKGIHRMRFDRWGDHSHKFEPYNLRFHASRRAQNEVERYEVERRRASSTPPHPSRRPNPGQEDFRLYKNSRASRMRSAPGRNPYRPETEDLSSSQDETWRSPYDFKKKSKSRRARTSKRTESYYPPSPQYVSLRHPTTDEEDNNSMRPVSSAQGRPPPPEREGFPLRRTSTLDSLPQVPPEGEDVPDTELPEKDSLMGEASQASPATPSDPPSPTGPPPAHREGAFSYLQSQLNRAREV